MTYEAWRISYQSSEQAARAAHEECMRLRAELTDLRNSMAFRTSLIGRIEAEREDLHALIAAVKKQVNAEFRLRMKKEIECNALRAKVEAMEQQVPICRAEDLKHAESLLPTLGLKPENPLYALPGAKGE